MGDLTENFSRNEFACKCGCGRDNINPNLAGMIQIARYETGFMLRINSGMRCPDHNVAEKGKATSSHLTGFAADIKCETSMARYDLLNALIHAGFRRIGIAKDFIHVDIDHNKTQDVMWVY